MPKVEITNVEVSGSRMAIEAKFDTGETIRYITSTSRSEAEIERILQRKYNEAQEAKEPAKKKAAEDKKKKLVGKKFDF